MHFATHLLRQSKPGGHLALDSDFLDIESAEIYSRQINIANYVDWNFTIMAP
jgi:hypothetical protein